MKHNSDGLTVIPTVCLIDMSSDAQMNVNATVASFGSTNDDSLYKEKIRELQVYLDHLKRSLDQQQREGGSKFKNIGFSL